MFLYCLKPLLCYLAETFLAFWSYHRIVVFFYGLHFEIQEHLHYSTTSFYAQLWKWLDLMLLPASKCLCPLFSLFETFCSIYTLKNLSNCYWLHWKHPAVWAISFRVFQYSEQFSKHVRRFIHLWDFFEAPIMTLLFFMLFQLEMRH